MIFVRSVVFNILFYLNLLLHMVGGLPTFLLPGWTVMEVAKSWGRTSLWLLRVICNIEVEFVGREKIPAGPLIFAAKHQSVWETFALMPLLDYPVFILKRELMWLPLFGWMLWKGGMIPVDRGARTQALVRMMKRARDEIPFGRGRQLIIFPEGTRRPPGAEPKYKLGVVHLYAQIGVPCVPVALNSGLFWPRHSFLRLPGTVRVEILDPIPPGLDKREFFERLQSTIEEATARLVAQGKQELAQAGFAPSA